MDRRRLVVFAFAALAPGTPLTVRGQAPAKPARIGTMWAGTTAGSAHLMRGFIQGLEDAGFVEGKNIALQSVFADTPEGLKPFAERLVREKVDAIFAAGNAAVDAARQAAPSTPTVFALTSDPLKLGFVKSLNRPGGNLTGTTLATFSVIGKRLEILREILPRARRLGVLYQPAEASAQLVVPLVEEAAKRVGLEVVKATAREAGELDAAFRQFEAARVDAVVPVDNPVFYGFREAIVAAAARHRLPTVHGNPEYSDLGGLLYYGNDLAESCRQAARLVAKILRGAKPADLPVEQPLRYQLFVNLKTARSLGVTIPQIVLLRADRVIE